VVQDLGEEPVVARDGPAGRGPRRSRPVTDPAAEGRTLKRWLEPPPWPPPRSECWRRTATFIPMESRPADEEHGADQESGRRLPKPSWL